MNKKVLIVGGVAGGASAATKLRRLDEKCEIIIFEKGEYISFANCGLPYHIGEVIKEKEKLIVVTPEKMKTRFNIDVRIKNVVTKIDRTKKIVEVYDIENEKKYHERYDNLILSPGAIPIKPAFPGIESNKIFTLRNIPDTLKIKSFVDNNKIKNAVIVGGGYIGLEVAENLVERGIKVTIVELSDQVMGPLDFDMATNVHNYLSAKGITLLLKNGVSSFEEKGSNINVKLSNNQTIETQIVVLGIGVKPDIEFIKDSDIEIGALGGIKVNEKMQTSDKSIYALGDAVEVADFVSGKNSLIPLAGPANKQGRIVAANICGIEETYNGTQGTAILKIFDIAVGVTGQNEKSLIKNGIAYEKSFTFSLSHASYYPGATSIGMKLIFDPQNGRIFGSQMVGYDGIDKRIDIISTAIRAKMTVRDLESLELAYAPPFSSAKDPVNFAGFVANNILKGDCKIIHWHDIDKIDKKSSIILDVRTKSEFEMGTIEGAINIDLDDLRNKLNEIPIEKNIYVFCQVGLRGYLAYRILVQNGYKYVWNLSGGYKNYENIFKKKIENDIPQNEKIIGNDEIMASTITLPNNSVLDSIKVDACGMQCPGPIIEVFKQMKNLNWGESMTVTATDPGFKSDIKTWCERTGHELISIEEKKGVYKAKIVKKNNQVTSKVSRAKSIVVFSNDLDKALATFIIANGAAAMGREVTLFFTFWGLNLLRKSEYVPVKKDLISKMFGMMMPRGHSKVKLSKMHMLGFGTKMMKFVMENKNVSSLGELIDQALSNNVRLVACNMSMDIMGIKKEELLDGIEYAGVASFIGSAEDSDTTLFI